MFRIKQTRVGGFVLAELLQPSDTVVILHAFNTPQSSWFAANADNHGVASPGVREIEPESDWIPVRASRRVSSSPRS